MIGNDKCNQWQSGGGCPKILNEVLRRGKFMESVQELTERIEALIEENKPADEIFQILSPSLRNDREVTDISERLAQIPHETAARILQRLLAEMKEKKLQKTIKRSLHRLKTRGIRVEEIDRKGASILRPVRIEPARGFGTAVGRDGERLLMLVVPPTASHMAREWAVIRGMVSDTRGLIQVIGEEMSRREFRGFFESFRSKSPLPVIEMEPSYVAFLFFCAYQLTLARKVTPPQDFFDFKEQIERLKKEYGQPLIYSCVSVNEIEGSWRRRGEELWKNEVLATWTIEEKKIRPYADAVTEALKSKLFINENQREVRFQEIYRQALAGIFSEDIKNLYKRRLEEMAYIFLQSEREEDAKTCLSVAIDLEKPLNPLQPNPFLLQLISRSILALIAEREEERRKEPSLIVRP